MLLLWNMKECILNNFDNYIVKMQEKKKNWDISQNIFKLFNFHLKI